ncbi:MAG TPA: SDR family oxidoreductase [Aestuariivirga sp.]|nr:SDR family oxidoreductase [Aestuariivirga sp.]
MNELRNKRVLVTGAANGIGMASAMRFQELGARVVGLDLKGSENPFPILKCDLNVEAEIVQAVASGASLLGGIDILVNNAGIMQESPIDSITKDHIDRHFAVNVRGTILVTREALRHLGEGSRIINIASELAYLGRANASVYCATKGAILGLTRAWARELAPRILVNAVAPGPTDTSLLGFETLSNAQKLLETAHPLGRIGKPEEIAAAVMFLAGAGATFFTGQCLGANGGAAMY